MLTDNDSCESSTAFGHQTTVSEYLVQREPREAVQGAELRFAPAGVDALERLPPNVLMVHK